MRLLCLLPVALAACASTPDYGQTLAEGAPALIECAADEVPDFAMDWSLREEILPALDHSIDWIHRPHAKNHFPIEGVDINRARASLVRFRDVLTTSSNRKEFDRRIRGEFTWYKSAGWNGRGGGVLFTGYCTPLLEGSLTPGDGYDHPLYALPPDLVKHEGGTRMTWAIGDGNLAYPGRSAIEAGAMLEGKGLELAWLKSPLDAYIAHVNGSAFIRLPDGEVHRLGYAGNNGAPYRSLGKELIADGVMPAKGLSLQSLRTWEAESDPALVREYLHRCPRYVFFQQIEGTPHGSLDVPVTAERSVATDKKLFPRASIMFVTTDLPGAHADERIPMQQFLFDQDTGGAIQSAGRADLYLGIGPDAEEMAGRVYNEGQMYYLFLKE